MEKNPNTKGKWTYDMRNQRYKNYKGFQDRNEIKYFF